MALQLVEITKDCGKAFAAARRICLVQLPVPDPDYALTSANVPLAAACLKSAVSGLGREIVLLPEEIADRGGDALILRWLISMDFDAVCFSLYLWNRERSAWMAARLKDAKPGMLCAAGGPEVQSGRGDADLSVFDRLIEGEGEEAFFRLLGGVGRFQNAFFPPSEGFPSRIKSFASLQPYLSGALKMGPGRPVFLETMRGCPRSCSYCHYGRNSGPPRYLPLDAVEAVFRFAGESGVREIYLMDPSLSARPRFEEFLSSIARWNGTEMAIHAEMPLEDVTEERARLMADAGITSVEAGLQSVNPRALRAVGRSWDRKRFEAGARRLADREIRVQLGLIVGLPHDGIKEIEASLRYAKELGLQEAAGAFPLAVLPGTELRARASEYGMEYMDEPPYYLLSNEWLPRGLMREAMLLPGEIWGRDQQEPVKPHFSAGAEPIEFIDLRAGSGIEKLTRPEGLSYSLTLVLGPPEAADRRALLSAARLLGETSPFTQYQLVWTADPGSLPDPADMDIVAAAFSRPDSLADRLRYFEDPGAARGARRFFLARDAAQALRWAEDGRLSASAELILDLRGDTELRDLAAEYDWDVLPFLLLSDPDRAAGPWSEAYEGFGNLILAADAAFGTD